VTEDHGEVGRLSPRGDVAWRLNPYPADYGLAFACSPILHPQPLQLALRLAFLGDAATSSRETTGLTRSADVILVRGLGSVSAPVGRHLRQGSSEPLDLPTCRFGPSVSAAYACSLWRRVCDGSLMLALPRAA